MLNFQPVNKNQIQELAQLANIIWHEYWKGKLSDSQIEYMIDKFQSEKAIKNQINNEKYTYYFIIVNGINAGYFGISAKEDYLFLSKLYISKDYRSKGFGTKTFEKIKEIASEQNYTRIELTVNKYNTNTIKTYEKWGFQTVDSVVTDIGSGFVMDDYIMDFLLN